MATRMGFEPTIFGVTGRYVNRYTTGPHKAPDHRSPTIECMSFNFECQDAWRALVPSGMEPKEKYQYLTLVFSLVTPVAEGLVPEGLI